MVVHSKDLELLCVAVHQHMKNGYIPSGGIAVLATLQETIYLQAVFRIEIAFVKNAMSKELPLS